MATNLSDIPVGTKAEIEYRTETGTESVRLFPTLIDSTDEDKGEIRLLAPISMLSGYRIHSGEMFRLYFQMNDMLLQAWCVATGYEKSNRIILLVARIAENEAIENANRRNDYRVKTVISVELWQIKELPSDHKKLSIPATVPLKCLSVDISARGMRLLVPRPLRQGDYAICRVKLEKGEFNSTIFFGVQVVRSAQREKNDPYPFDVGIFIKTISRADETILVRYCLACQREALRLRADST